MKLSVVIPCYNEAENIPLLLKKLKWLVKNYPIEIILVDNGSTDNTEDILMKLLPNYPFARQIKVDVNKGYGYGILQGLRVCSGEYVGWTHADMQTDPGDLIKAYKIILRHPDEKIYIKGRRKGRPFLERLFTNGMGIFETLYMGEKLIDVNAQPNVFPKKFMLSWVKPPTDFSLDLYALYMAKQKGIKVIRFSVLFPERKHGMSHWNTGLRGKWKFIKRTLIYSIKLKKMLA